MGMQECEAHTERANKGNPQARVPRISPTKPSVMTPTQPKAKRIALYASPAPEAPPRAESWMAAIWETVTGALRDRTEQVAAYLKIKRKPPVAQAKRGRVKPGLGNRTPNRFVRSVRIQVSYWRMASTEGGRPAEVRCWRSGGGLGMLHAGGFSFPLPNHKE
jgi:hypothetical protein